MLEGEVEGYEYIIATNRDLSRFNSINDRIRDENFDFNGKEDLSEIRIIDATSPNDIKFNSKYVLFDRFNFSIVNKNSTKRFLKELQNING